MFFSNAKRMDWALNGAVLALSLIGLLTIYSVAPSLFWPQLTWFLVSIIFIVGFAQINWRPLINYRWLVFGIYLLGVFLLILTFFFAPTIRGIRGWLVLGPLQFQTAEFAKIALIIIFAYFFAHRHISIGQWKNIVIPFIYLLVPAIFVLLQPDMGSALVLFGIWAGFLLISGIRWRHLAIGFLLIATILFIGWGSFLEDYQKERIIGLFNPDHDPLGVNYSVIQSKIAIGSAGFLGKGFQQGTQTQLGFLPEAANDFIFAAFIEEWGLLGAVFLLGAFSLMFYRIIKIGLKAGNNFSKLICLGALVMFLVHIILNAGSNLGLVPVVGISLPFVSYGGSNLLISAIVIGLVQSVAVHARY